LALVAAHLAREFQKTPLRLRTAGMVAAEQHDGRNEVSIDGHGK
jgi:hypothetical protein